MTFSAACATRIVFRSASRYTGKERDTESGNDYFGARYYASSMGRFMSPDPSQLVYADQTNPQSLNLYSYVRNNPLVFTDPTGLWLQLQCNPSETWDDKTSTLTYSANCSTYEDGQGQPSGGIPSRPSPPPVKLPARSPSIPCNKTTAYRVTQGILGATNLTLAGLKTAALGGADTVLAAAAPFTGGATAVVAAGVTVYGVTSIGGQAISGTGQLYTAFTGDAEGGEGLSQVGDILAGPLSGISTLLTTNDPALAQRNANAESLITAGSGLVGKAPVKETIQSGVDTALSLFGIGGNGCPP
jgi:RHS repeat-associated protein